MHNHTTESYLTLKRNELMMQATAPKKLENKKYDSICKKYPEQLNREQVEQQFGGLEVNINKE